MKRGMRGAGLWGTVMLVIVLPAAAQTPETTKEEDLQRLFVAAGIDAQANAMLENVGQMMADTLVSQLPAGPQAEQARGALVRYLELLEAGFRERMPALLIGIYDEAFTHEEVRELIGFWESDVGQRMRDLSPALANAGREAGTNLVAALLPGIADDMTPDYPEFAAGLRTVVIETFGETAYVNRTHRFSLETPPGWTINGPTRVQSGAAAWLDAPDRTAAVSVAFQNPGPSLAELAGRLESQETIEGFANREISAEETTLEGRPALIRVTQAGPVATVRAIVQEEERIAIISGRTTIVRLGEDEGMLRAIVTSYRRLRPLPAARDE
jgi:hypothetical protein